MPSIDMKTYQRKWVANRKAKYMAGKVCYFCKADQEIEIHHLDPEQKESHKIWSWSEERIVEELKKCIFLCKSCHTKFHAVLRGVDFRHGLQITYDKFGCRCDYCRAAKNLSRRTSYFRTITPEEAKEKLAKIYNLEDHQIDKLVFEYYGRKRAGGG